MNNNTKRDVFEDIVDSLNVIDGAPDEYCKKLLDRYDAALPDNIPVIPEVVGEYIKWGKKYDIKLYMMYVSQFIDRTGFKKLTDDDKIWIISSSNIFASAWLLGVWAVEETGEIVKLEAEK